MDAPDLAACPLCSCLCDDLRLTHDGGRITRCENACHLAEPWLLGLGQTARPTAAIEGRPVAIEAAVDRAAELLDQAWAPLVYGLVRSSTAARRAAVALGERTGATIDPACSPGVAASLLATQEVGEATCTLGEVRNRADLVVFWGADPVTTHPRHLERYALFARGRFTRSGRRDRTLVVVDQGPTATSALADLHVPVDTGKDFEALSVLAALLRDAPLRPEAETGAPLDRLQSLAARMKGCRYGIVFYGPGLAARDGGSQHVEALLRLVRDLNRTTRFSARSMGPSAGTRGADLVLTWQTGFPVAVNLARGYPRYQPNEGSAGRLLDRGEVDAAVVVGSAGLEALGPRAVAHLRRIPTVVLDEAAPPPGIAPTVCFTTAVSGVHRSGTAYRMDGVPVRLRAPVPSDYPSDEDVLTLITRRLATGGTAG